MKRPDSDTLSAPQEIVTHGAPEEYIKAACSAAIPQLRDGERYRWLRDNGHLDIWWSVSGPKDRCANIDADIDAARREGELNG